MNSLFVVLLVFHWSAGVLVPATQLGNPKQEKTATIETHPPVKATSGAPTFVLPDHRTVRSLGFTPDSKSLVSVSYAKAPNSDDARFVIRKWSIADKKLKREVELEWAQSWNRYAVSMMLSKSRANIISVLDEHQVGIWDVATGKIVRRLERPLELRDDRLCSVLDATPDLSRIACGSDSKYSSSALVSDSHVVVWDGNTGRIAQVILLKHAIHVHHVALSPDGKLLAAGGMAEQMNVWEVRSGKPLLDFHNSNQGRKHPDPEVKDSVARFILSAAFSPDGKQIAISDVLGVKLVDATSGKLRHRIDAPFRYDAGRFVFSADGQLLARFDTSNDLKSATKEIVSIWSTKTGNLVMSVAVDANNVSFSDDGKWFAVGLSDLRQAVALWQIPAPESIHQ